MQSEQVRRFMMEYLQATECECIEQSPAHVTVRLSPEADRELMGRPFYWDFVERTGAEPEPMTLTFVFKPEELEQAESAKEAERQKEAQNSDTILGRYLGIVPGGTAVGRSLREQVTFGSRRLQQIFGAARKQGKFVHLFEEAKAGTTDAAKVGSSGLTTWLCVNYKVEFVCDMKREELHSLGISLSTGEIAEHFHDRIRALALTPRLPARRHVRETISLDRAVRQLEQWLYNAVSGYDHGWADAAGERLDDELARVRSYYEELLQSLPPEEKEAAEQQYRSRLEEIRWQYEPRVQVTAVNAGLFHLIADSFRDRQTPSFRQK